MSHVMNPAFTRIEGNNQLLQDILSVLSGSKSNTRTPYVSVITASGTVPAGSKEAEFILDPSFVGTILGVAFSGSSDSAVRFSANNSDVLSAIPYTVTSGSFRLKGVL